MKYINADLLRKEIERRITDNTFGAKLELIDILAWLDSLQQEQSCDTCTNDKGCVTCKDGELWEGKEQPSEELEEAAIDYADYARRQPKDYAISSIADYDHGCIDGFKAGAEWQKEQMLRTAKDRYEQAMTFITGNSEVDQAIQMDRLALVKIIEEDKK